MLIGNVLKLTPYERLVYWIAERELIRLKRAQGHKAPWTDDEILRTYRFCNVRRMDDRVSEWLLHNWYEPYWNHRNMLPAVALARFLNLPSVLGVITSHLFGTEYHPDRVKSCLRLVKRDGYPVFNGAYMVRGGLPGGAEDKIGAVVDVYVGGLLKDPPSIDRHSMRNTHATLSRYYGFGSFAAGQVVADLRWALDGQWSDYLTWAPIGPGSKRGMNRLLERPLKTPMTQHTFDRELGKLMRRLCNSLPRETVVRLEAMDFQNCCCEYDKYSRALLGEGKPKQLYRPRS